MGSSNRTIIIPKGTLNSDDVNVVVIPKGLRDTHQPLIVTSSAGNKLAAKSLPIWGDDLDTHNERSFRTLGTTEEEEDASDLENFEEDTEFGPKFESTRVCRSKVDKSPKIVHVSSKTLSLTNLGPPEGVEITINAPEGIDFKVFQTVMKTTKPSSQGTRTINQAGQADRFANISGPTVNQAHTEGTWGQNLDQKLNINVNGPGFNPNTWVPAPYQRPLPHPIPYPMSTANARAGYQFMPPPDPYQRPIPRPPSTIPYPISMTSTRIEESFSRPSTPATSRGYSSRKKKKGHCGSCSRS